MTRTLATITVEAAWTGNLTGVFRLDTSLLDGTDGLAGIFGSNTFDDLTADVKSVQITRGRSSALSTVDMGTALITLNDPSGKYNPRAIRYSDTVLADSPVGYWRLGEAEGSTDAADGSGNGRTGTYVGGVTLQQDGALLGSDDRAALFDGSSGLMRRLSFPSSAAFTLEVWVKPTVLKVQMLMEVGVDGVALTRLFMTDANGIIEFDNQPGEIGNVQSVTPITAGTWWHIVATFDGATARLYLNGVLEASTVASYGWSTGTLNFAAGASGPFSSVAMDEVAVYATALSAARVLAHYQAGTRYLAERLVPMRPVRVRASHLATNYGLFYGFTRRIWHDPHKGVKESFLECVDLFTWLNRAKPTIAATGATTVGAAIGRILDAIGWDDPILRALDTGMALSNFSADGTKTGVALIGELLAVDLGLFFINGAGVATYLDRDSRWRRASPVDTFDGNALAGALPAIDGERIVNRQSVTRTSGVAQSATDTASAGAYGYADGSSITSDYLSTDAQALNLAQFLVALQRDPQAPASNLLLNNTDDTVIVQQLTRELGDRVAVTETSGNTSFEGAIDRLQFVIAEGATVFQSQYTVTERVVTGFTLDVSAMDGVDVLAY